MASTLSYEWWLGVESVLLWPLLNFFHIHYLEYMLNTLNSEWAYVPSLIAYTLHQLLMFVFKAKNMKKRSKKKQFKHTFDINLLTLQQKCKMKLSVNYSKSYD